MGTVQSCPNALAPVSHSSWNPVKEGDVGRPTQLLLENQDPLEENLTGEDVWCVVRARAPEPGRRNRWLGGAH